MKFCRKCEQEKALKDFHTDKHAKDGKRSACKACSLAYKRLKYKQNPIKFRNRSLKNTFGLTRDQKDEMLRSQNNLCAICQKPETAIHNLSKQVQELAIDHSHLTGKIRELLCSKCNLLLGNAKDDIELLRKCIAYLEKHL